jgi:GrpB-like predicted nucleotidyltransferase (UPF0157 family)
VSTRSRGESKLKKQLSEMSIKELWELFPVMLMEHNPQYKHWYDLEKQNILKAIRQKDIIRINHIGSSAVKGLISKPTVDILLEVDQVCEITLLTDELIKIGWGLMRRESSPLKLSFCKGYTPDGFAEKVYHLHVRYFDDWDELYFRDFLIAHPDVAEEYGKLKQRLCNDLKHDRDGYTDAKSEFILKYSTLAKHQYQNKYK